MWKGATQILEQCPVAISRILAIVLGQVVGEVALDMVIVQQRVVDIERKDHVIHGALSHGRGGDGDYPFEKLIDPDRLAPFQSDADDGDLLADGLRQTDGILGGGDRHSVEVLARQTLELGLSACIDRMNFDAQ